MRNANLAWAAPRFAVFNPLGWAQTGCLTVSIKLYTLRWDLEEKEGQDNCGNSGNKEVIASTSFSRGWRQVVAIQESPELQGRILQWVASTRQVLVTSASKWFARRKSTPRTAKSTLNVSTAKLGVELPARQTNFNEKQKHTHRSSIYQQHANNSWLLTY